MLTAWSIPQRAGGARVERCADRYPPRRNTCAGRRVSPVRRAGAPERSSTAAPSRQLNRNGRLDVQTNRIHTSAAAGGADRRAVQDSRVASREWAARVAPAACIVDRQGAVAPDAGARAHRAHPRGRVPVGRRRKAHRPSRHDRPLSRHRRRPMVPLRHGSRRSHWRRAARHPGRLGRVGRAPRRRDDRGHAHRAVRAPSSADRRARLSERPHLRRVGAHLAPPSHLVARRRLDAARACRAAGIEG